METSAPSPRSARGIDASNRRRLELLHRETKGPFDVRRAAEVLALDEARARDLLAYLARRGWLSRVRRGLYIPVPLDARRPGEWSEDPWIVAQRIYSPCYVGGWSACEHWGLTEQLFRTIMIVTSRTVRDREPVIDGTAYRVTVRRQDRIFGTRPVWRGQVRVEVSDPSRTIVDVLDDPSLGGGIRHVAEVVEEYFAGEHRDDDLLLHYAERFGNRAVLKRLGYLLETLRVDAAGVVDRARARLSSGVATLDPSVDGVGVINTRWRLRVNVDLGHRHPTA